MDTVKIQSWAKDFLKNKGLVDPQTRFLLQTLETQDQPSELAHIKSLMVDRLKNAETGLCVIVKLYEARYLSWFEALDAIQKQENPCENIAQNSEGPWSRWKTFEKARIAKLVLCAMVDLMDNNIQNANANYAQAQQMRPSWDKLQLPFFIKLQKLAQQGLYNAENDCYVGSIRSHKRNIL